MEPPLHLTAAQSMLEEPLELNTGRVKRDRREAALEMIRKVCLRPEHADRFPDMLSCGQR